MEKRLLGKTGFKISPVFYGGVVSMEDGQKASDTYVSYAIDHGINYFDVAPTYGDAQEKLGNSLRPYRKNIYLACKTEQRGKQEAQKALEESFRLLHTDYFDIYQLHGLADPAEVDAAFDQDGAMEVLIRAKEKGDVRKLGITCHSEEAALKALSLYDFDTVLFPVNWGLHLGKGFGNRLLDVIKERGIGLLGMKALIHRAWISEEEKISSTFTKSWCKPILDNDDLCLAAMKYALSLGAVSLVPPGNFTHFSFVADHIEECLKHPISEEELLLLKEELPHVTNHYFL